MRTDADTAEWLRLALLPELGPRAFRALLKAFGLPRDVLRADYAELASVVRPSIARAVLAGPADDALRRTLDWLADPRHHLITLGDAEYPPLLLQISDPPPVLYMRGSAALLARPSLAIVGSRNATPQGRATAESFARLLSDAGITIVSGFAAGIDAAAHKGALEGQASTIAVLGTGADIVYPRSNAPLASSLAERGAMISEFALGTPPLAPNFPRRNRLISALSRGYLVVEAALQSGSLITARFAAEQGRDVFAIPGSIHSPVARGCHALIREGAKLVDSAEHVLEELGVPFAPAGGPQKSAVCKRDVLDPDATFIQYMGYEPCDIDALTLRSGLTPETVSAMLLKLELEGRVGSLPGGLYQRTA